MEPLFALPHRLAPLLGPLFQGQAFFLVQPIHQVLAHLPALTPQQHQNLAVPIPHPALRDLPDAGSEFRPRLVVTLVAIGAADNP